MKTLLFAVFLALVQTPPPVPATDNPANTPRSQASRHKPIAPASTPSPPANVINSISNENSGDTVRSKDQPKTVRVNELRPVTIPSPKRDWADWGTWAFNPLLVVTSGFQVWLLCKTLMFVRRQTHEMKCQRIVMRRQLSTMQGQLSIMERQTKAAEDAARAAKDSADVARDVLHLTQAADVHIEEIKLFPNGLLSGDTTIYVVVKNHGQTRAERFTDDLTLGIKERAAGITLPRRDIETVIGPGNTRSIAFGPLQRGLLSADLDMVLGGQLLLKIWGPLKYRDIFGNGHVIDCECTYNLQVGNFLIDRYEHRHQEDTQAN
jgi:hypothetical protein